MHLYIKNMVCDRCIMVVQDFLQQMGLSVKNIQLGDVEIETGLTPEQKIFIKEKLESLGFELIDDRKNRMIEKIKSIIIHLVHHQDNQIKYNLSEILFQELNHDYSYLSSLFSEAENTTIEKFFIAQKIERIKELLVYDELTLSEISDLLNYSSVSYLSNQFKKTTGMTPTQFKNSHEKKRIPLDQI